MDQAEFDALLPKSAKTPAAGSQQQQPPEGQAEGGIDLSAIQSAADAAGIDLSSITEGAAPPEDAPEPTASELDAQGKRPDGTSYSEAPAQEPGLGDASGLDAPLGGGIKSVFETKDFLFGDTPADERTDFRKGVEDTVDLRRQQSVVDGVTASIGQFAVAMVGLGKLSLAGKALPWFGRGLAALETTKKGKAALEVGKAATAGAIAFDPYEERLANMLAGSPISNPAFEWLAADPEDGEAEARMKAALESIALDATIIGVFFGSTKIWKALRKGDSASAARHVDEMEVAQKAAAEELPVAPDLDVADPAALADEAAIRSMDNATAEITGDVPRNAGAGQAGQADSAAPGVGSGGATGEAATSGVERPAITGSPAEAAAVQGEDLLSARLGRLRVTEDDTEAVLKGMEDDAAALAAADGSYSKAIDGGYTFGKSEGIPYEKFNSDVDVQDFMDRVVETKQEAMDRVRGGAVVTDEQQDRLVAKMTTLFNEDPASVVAMIQKSGKEASRAVTMMETGFLVTSRVFQDAHALSQRIALGDYTGWGNREGAIAELRKRLSVGASTYAATRSIVAASGRGVRRMRFEFSVDPEKVGALMSMDGDELAKLMVDTGGDLRRISKVANPSWWEKGMSGMGWLLVNNLVSGPKTQLVNLIGNSFMLGVRPMERLVGGAIQRGLRITSDNHVTKEALKQYAYMGNAFTESWRLALKAFMRNDSVLSPHNTEQFIPGQAVSSNLGPTPFKPFDSIGNILGNALTVATPKGAARAAVTAVGMPTRVLGTVDEAMKQITYRSKVMAKAHLAGVEAASKLPAGTSDAAKKKFVAQFVRDRVDNSVDQMGRGLDADALREAQMTTFQQELLPGSLGRTVQSAVFKHPASRLILPFVKTPTNVLRTGWKMTPGLNLLQTEYRQMLSGKAGVEAQAQAMGQMALGTLYIGAAAFLASSGTLTGGGPSQWASSSAMQDTGYQDYAFVIENDDGTTTFVPLDRYDPLAMPIFIIADIMDALYVRDGEETPEIGAAMGALTYALARQMTNKTYLMGLADLMDVMSDPDPDKISRWTSKQASNFVPFSAALRQMNPDPYMREARTMADKLKAGLPGFSEKVPPRYDWLGEPRIVRKGLWSSTDDDLVDNEVIRLGLENDGNIITLAQPNQSGVDLRDITMSNGENAYAAYQRLSGKPTPGSPSLKSQIAKLMRSEAYRNAPDGDVGTKGTKLWLLHTPVSKYRGAAMKVLKHDPKVRDAFGEDQKKVLEHYSDLRGERPRKRKEVGDLSAVGEAYGIDLGIAE